MLRKNKRNYIKNKLINSIKIKKFLKVLILKSIIHNQSIPNNIRSNFFVKYKLTYQPKTSINDTCLNSAVYKKSSKNFNFSRYEFHNLCRTNKLSS